MSLLSRVAGGREEAGQSIALDCTKQRAEIGLQCYFGSNADTDGGDGGNAVLSDDSVVPLVSALAVSLPVVRTGWQL